MSSKSASPRSATEKMTLIAGPCVIEDEGLLLEIAGELKRQLAGLPIELYFKASFDKANRSSIEGFRGPGLQDGLKQLENVKIKSGLPILTDFHTPDQAAPVAEIADFLQIPAFLCRQTDMILAGATAALKRGRRLNVKKGQFLAPWDAKNIVEKVRDVEAQAIREGWMGSAPARAHEAGVLDSTPRESARPDCAHEAGVLDSTPRESARPRTDWLCLTERGVTHGYNTLVVDMVSFQTMAGFGVPTIYDATHSIQKPGGGAGGKSTGGQREYLEVLARAAMAAGADGLFMECHPRPAQAKSDGPNAFYLEHVGEFVRQMLAFRDLARRSPKLLPEAKNA